MNNFYFQFLISKFVHMSSFYTGVVSDKSVVFDGCSMKAACCATLVTLITFMGANCVFPRTKVSSDLNSLEVKLLEAI